LSTILEDEEYIVEIAEIGKEAIDKSTMTFYNLALIDVYLSDIEDVKMAHAVTGQFDVIALVSFPKIEDLGKIIEKTQHLKGVQ
jgi:CheY-like chemotaxis protein